MKPQAPEEVGMDTSILTDVGQGPSAQGPHAPAVESRHFQNQKQPSQLEELQGELGKQPPRWGVSYKEVSASLTI